MVKTISIICFITVSFVTAAQTIKIGGHKKDSTMFVYGIKNDVNGEWVFINGLGESVNSTEVDFPSEKTVKLKDQRYKLVDGYAREGFHLIQSEDYKYGYANKYGDIVIPCIYRYASPFSGGLAAVKKRWWWKTIYINKSGEKVFVSGSRSAKFFSEGLAYVSKGNKYGFVDKTGNTIIPPSFSYASYFSNGRARVRGKDKGKYGYINRKGEIVIDYSYQSAQDFINSLAIVSTDKINYFFIDTLERPVFSKVYLDVNPFYRGLARVKTEKGYGYINTKGEMVITPQFIMANDFYGPLALVKTGTHTESIPGISFTIKRDINAFIDREGNIILKWLSEPVDQSWFFDMNTWGPEALETYPVKIQSKPSSANVYFIPGPIVLDEPGVVNQPNKLALRLQPNKTDNTYYVYPSTYLILVEYGARIARRTVVVDRAPQEILIDFNSEEDLKDKR